MNRKDRRADPPRWYKLDAYFDKRTEHVHGLDDKHAQYVLGRIDDIVIVQVPDDMAPAQRIAFMQGFREVAALASQEMKYILVPQLGEDAPPASGGRRGIEGAGPADAPPAGRGERESREGQQARRQQAEAVVR